MIIVEGADLVGKTTLCKKLVERLPGHVYAHFTRLPDSFDRYWGYHERASRGIVQDRFHMSEVAYAAMRGDLGSSGLTPEVYRLVDARLRRLGCMTVLLVAEPELLERRMREGEMYNISQILHVNAIFKEIIESRGGSLGYDMDVDFWTEGFETKPYVLEEEIDELVERYETRQETLRDITDRVPISL